MYASRYDPHPQRARPAPYPTSRRMEDDRYAPRGHDRGREAYIRERSPHYPPPRSNGRAIERCVLWNVDATVLPDMTNPIITVNKLPIHHEKWEKWETLVLIQLHSDLVIMKSLYHHLQDVQRELQFQPHHFEAIFQFMHFHSNRFHLHVKNMKMEHHRVDMTFAGHHVKNTRHREDTRQGWSLVKIQ